MSKYVLKRTRPSKVRMAGYVEYLTVKNGIPEFSAPGNTASGVGVANLKAWKSEAGARRWMAENAYWLSAQAIAGEVQLVQA